MRAPINVAVVYKQHEARRVLGKIRQWSHRVDEPIFKNSLKVTTENNLNSAFTNAFAQGKNGILITIGFSDDEIDPYFQMVGRQGEIIIRPPRTGYRKDEINDFPSASLLNPYSSIVHVQDTISALKKSILRIKTKKDYEIKQIETEEDFEQYFALRYRVWDSLGYISPEHKSKKTQWEVNYSDRSAVPIGCFLNDGELIGTARLVFPQGRESKFTELIERMIHRKDDPILQTSYKYPERMMHPFDVLYSFSGFQRYYARLRKRRIYTAEVSRIIVTTEHRNKGIGQVIVDSVKSLARQRGLSLVFLACLEKHAPFYQMSGFQILKDKGMRCDSFTGVNVPAIAMAQNI